MNASPVEQNAEYTCQLLCAGLKPSPENISKKSAAKVNVLFHEVQTTGGVRGQSTFTGIPLSNQDFRPWLFHCLLQLRITDLVFAFYEDGLLETGAQRHSDERWSTIFVQVHVVENTKKPVKFVFLDKSALKGKA